MNLDTYLYGRCHIFALALQEELGYSIELFWDLEAWFDKDGMKIDTALVHAYCIGSDNVMFDARGRITREVVEEDYEFNEPEILATSPQRLCELMDQGVLETLKLGELDSIRAYIRNNLIKYT
ncbi:hypothetical protein POF51_29485 [Brevibacillus sp. AG]|uniref:hypothetical protein n=1 Tax=Brevibacillus sp. AG TaxID=3020891 RepID=UPI00232CB4E1|nr:hypothetical protein [Brevibacillus sp. AG]MDC0764857.1 hypothetical protein [Brevibacillus sp. AG]